MCLSNRPLLQLAESCGARDVSFKSWTSICGYGQSSDIYKQEVSKCHTLSEIRRIASRIEGFEAAVQDSLSPVKILLSQVFSRLQFNERCIELFASAAGSEISDFWGALLAVDATLREDIKYTKKTFAGYPAAVEFIHHC